MNHINIAEETGMIVEKNSPLELAKAINHLAESKEKRVQFSKNSYARFKKHFEYKNVLPSYLDIYR